MIKVKRSDFIRKEVVDESPDLSWLGEYTDHPKADYYIDRQNGTLVGPSVTEERKFRVIRTGESHPYELGDYKLYAPTQEEVSWLDAASGLDGGDLEYCADDDTDNLTVVWTHPEILADGQHTMGRNQLRYFVSCNHSKPRDPKTWGKSKSGRFTVKEKARMERAGVTLNLKAHNANFWRDVLYTCEDYGRAEAYNRGDWHMLGIRAQVEVRIPTKHNSWIVHTVHSPGLWGIASDGNDSYREQVFQDECSVLVDMLKEMGMKVVQ